MRKVYLLEHAYSYGKDLECFEIKTLGIYSTVVFVQKAIVNYSMLPGFNEFSNDCFYISPLCMNCLNWSNGFNLINERTKNDFYIRTKGIINKNGNLFSNLKKIEKTNCTDTIYLLEHAYDYGKNAEHTEVKTLGVFSSESMAYEAISYYKILPGFKEFSDECFFISKLQINIGRWSEGFICV